MVCIPGVYSVKPYACSKALPECLYPGGAPNPYGLDWNLLKSCLYLYVCMYVCICGVCTRQHLDVQVHMFMHTLSEPNGELQMSSCQCAPLRQRLSLREFYQQTASPMILLFSPIIHLHPALILTWELEI